MTYYQMISQALENIEDQIQEQPSIESIAESLNISKFYFHRIFSAMVGMSFQQYLVKRRLNRGLVLMEDPSMSLTDIAYEVGFSSSSAFTNSFKNTYGMTPKNMRMSIENFPIEDVPELVHRSLKNINGDLVVDFDLGYIEVPYIKGIVFEIDLGDPDYMETIASMSQVLLTIEGIPRDSKAYMIYSNCRPNSSKFNAILGLSIPFESDLACVMVGEIQKTFCASFNYKGDLLEISDIFTSDMTRFLKITKYVGENHDIELIQTFDSLDSINKHFTISVPIVAYASDL